MGILEHLDRLDRIDIDISLLKKRIKALQLENISSVSEPICPFCGIEMKLSASRRCGRRWRCNACDADLISWRADEKTV